MRLTPAQANADVLAGDCFKAAGAHSAVASGTGVGPHDVTKDVDVSFGTKVDAGDEYEVLLAFAEVTLALTGDAPTVYFWFLAEPFLQLEDEDGVESFVSLASGLSRYNVGQTMVSAANPASAAGWIGGAYDIPAGSTYKVIGYRMRFNLQLGFSFSATFVTKNFFLGRHKADWTSL